jgi:hypothetical protein
MVMRDFDLAMLLRPFIMLAIFAVVVIPLELLFIKFFPDGPLKRRLLRRL